MSSMSKWKCSLCTYRNHHLLPKCEMCDTAQIAHPLNESQAHTLNESKAHDDELQAHTLNESQAHDDDQVVIQQMEHAIQLQIDHKPNNNHNKRKKQTNTSHDSHPSMANTVSTHSNNKAKRCLRTVDPHLLQTEVNNKAARQLHVTDNDNDKTGNDNDDIPFKRRKRKRKREETTSDAVYPNKEQAEPPRKKQKTTRSEGDIVRVDVNERIQWIRCIDNFGRTTKININKAQNNDQIHPNTIDMSRYVDTTNDKDPRCKICNDPYIKGHMFKHCTDIVKMTARGTHYKSKQKHRLSTAEATNLFHSSLKRHDIPRNPKKLAQQHKWMAQAKFVIEQVTMLPINDA
eukprot:584962_1